MAQAYFYRGTTAQINARMHTLENQRLDVFSKWNLPDYTRKDDFYIFERAMLNRLKDAKINGIADGSILCPERVDLFAIPAPTPAEINHNEASINLYNEANSIVYSLVEKVGNAENKFFEDSSGVPDGDGRLLWKRLTMN